MSRTLCIPCLNMEYFDCDILIHRWSKAICSECGVKPYQGLLVSIAECPGKRKLLQEEKEKMSDKGV